MPATNAMKKRGTRIPASTGPYLNVVEADTGIGEDVDKKGDAAGNENEGVDGGGEEGRMEESPPEEIKLDTVELAALDD